MIFFRQYFEFIILMFNSSLLYIGIQINCIMFNLKILNKIFQDNISIGAKTKCHKYVAF